MEYCAVFKNMKISNVGSCYMLIKQNAITLRCVQEDSQIIAFEQ